jgi:seryl-tRNA synthetase
MTDLTEKLKETVQNATDAETVAHDALASIDARAEVIKNSMVTARTLLDDNAEIKFAIDATKKALADLESKRPKRDADPEDVDRRVNVLRTSASRITSLRSNVTKMMKTFKSRLADVRKKITGYTFCLLNFFKH